MSCLSPDYLIPLSMALPFCGAGLVALFGRWPNLRETATLVTATLLFLYVASFFDAVMGGAEIVWVVFPMLPGIDLAFSVEPLGYLFALLASFLWGVTSLYAIGYMRGHHEKNQTRFFICFALAIFSVMGLAFADNLMTMFLFYEMLTLCTYPLVTHAGTEKAKKGGRTYLGILLTTSMVFQLPAIIWVWVSTGTLTFELGGVLSGAVSPCVAATLLVLFIYGVGKAAVMPFHRWLPAAMVAPTPVSALLHAVAVVKAGVFSVLKIVVYIFGIDFLKDLVTRDVMLYIAAFTVIASSVVALYQDNLKRRLAYSTVSQLSYIVMGALLASKLGIIGGGMHMLMHAFGKITLFFGAGAIMVASHKTEVSQMRGIGRRMPVTMAAFLIGSLSIIGLPPMGGLWSKWFLGLGALEAGQPIIVGVLMVSALLNVAYLIPIAVQAFLSTEDVVPAHEHGEAPMTCVIAQVITAAGTVALFFWAEPFYDLLSRLV